MRVSEIKDRVSIEDVLVESGARIQHGWGDERPVYCPFHPNVNTPAGSVNVLKQLYFCHGCNAGGDVVRVAQLHLEQEGRDASFQAACEWLEGLIEE